MTDPLPAPVLVESAPGTPRSATSRRPWRVVGVLLLGIAMLGGIRYGHWALAEHRLVTVSEGILYQSAELPADALVELVESHGLRSVIDLRDDDQPKIDAEAAALAATGAVHLHLPTEQDPTPEQVKAFLAAIADPANRPALLHCEHGEGRSVLFAALYRIAQEGWDNETAWRESARLPNGLRFLRSVWPGLGSFRRDSVKGRYLLEFEPPAGAPLDR